MKTSRLPLIIDGLQYNNWSEDIFREMNEGGIAAVHVTICYHDTFLQHWQCQCNNIRVKNVVRSPQSPFLRFAPPSSPISAFSARTLRILLSLVVVQILDSPLRFARDSSFLAVLMFSSLLVYPSTSNTRSTFRNHSFQIISVRNNPYHLTLLSYKTLQNSLDAL